MTLPSGRAEERFADAKPLFTRAEAVAEASRCLYCVDAPCISHCPTAIDIPTFIRKIATGNVRGSARTILDANLLGASCARVCPVEELCEGACVYTEWGRPVIPIGRLQRYAMTIGGNASLRPLEKTAKRLSVALVGAGPASLACAGTLARLGHAATIYERDRFPGGLNATGVAPYKLPAEDALAEVRFIESLGVDIVLNTNVGTDVTPATLLAKHDHVFLGVGLGADTPLGVPGEDGPGVFGAVEWIRRMKVEPGVDVKGLRAVVVGGGNTAVDVTRELLGLGAETVTLIYRRSADRMSAYAHELQAARREGARVLTERAVTAVEREGEKVTGVTLAYTENGRPTDRAAGVEAADLVVVAIGQAKQRALAEQFEGVRVDDGGRIRVHPDTFVTDNPKIYAGGDAINGGQEVVNAVAHGQAAAWAMHEAAGGSRG